MHISDSKISQIFWGGPSEPPTTIIYDCTRQSYTNASTYKTSRYHLLRLLEITLTKLDSVPTCSLACNCMT